MKFYFAIHMDFELHILLTDFKRGHNILLLRVPVMHDDLIVVVESKVCHLAHVFHISYQVRKSDTLCISYEAHLAYLNI